jgi:Fe-S-cluster-containing dehydrogenase component
MAHRWGMAIDLDRCTGCEACVAACHAENNLAISTPEQAEEGRTTHWIRVDRYYEGNFPDVKLKYMPVLCQQCDEAPCEPVCPTLATYHNPEGLNVQVYNRCVGTFYCANNCPYTVRYFNWFDPVWPEPLQLQHNPDVAVRIAGVMEKCTFCIQRIQQAEIAQKVKARDTGNVLVPDGAESKDPTSLKTACQQACPAGAIVFGNIADPNSKVSQLKAQERNYSVLNFLLTKPRTTYLARLRNPNPAMPDFAEPLTLQEYKTKDGDPFKKRERHPSPFDADGNNVKGGKGAE